MVVPSAVLVRGCVWDRVWRVGSWGAGTVAGLAVILHVSAWVGGGGPVPRCACGAG